MDAHLDIVHCFYNLARHFSRWKVAFSAPIKLQILQVHMHVLFSPVALSLWWSFNASNVSAAISDTFVNLRRHRETLTQMLGNTNHYLTIRLFALNFYEVIVDEAEGRINYHLIEIESE